MCALGVDPRQDKEMRWYQTLIFQLEPEPRETKADNGEVSKTKMDRELAAKGEFREGHLFDGQTVSLDGKIWQMCDITDPLLKTLVETTALRDECHRQSDGWYANGVFAKIRILMKGKLELILAGDKHNVERNRGFLVLSQLVPDVMTQENRVEARFEKGTVDKWMMRMAEQMRNLALKPPGGRVNASGTMPSKKKSSWEVGRRRRKDMVPNGRGKKKRRGAKEDRPAANNGTRFGQEMLDPQLRDATAPLNRTERRAAMKAFEDETEDSNVDEDDDENESSDESEAEEDTGSDESE